MAGPRDREAGSAAIEALSVGLLLLVPLVYLVITLAALQGGAFAAEGVARQAARVYVLAPSDAEGRSRLESAAATGLADWHIPPSALQLALACRPVPADCRTPRGSVTVTARVAVALPLLPPALHLGAPGSIAMTAQATQRVSQFTAAAP